jgi:hypothetical protein
MIALLWFVLAVVAAPFKSKCRLEAENAALRHQLIVLRRTVHSHVRLTNNDRWFFIQLYRWFPSILQVLTIVRPETLVRWHRAGFRRYWRWKSRPLGGRPQIVRCADPQGAMFALQGKRNRLAIGFRGHARPAMVLVKPGNRRPNSIKHRRKGVHIQQGSATLGNQHDHRNA